MAAKLLTYIDIPQMLADIERADTLGPLLDPTLWMNKSEAMNQDRELLKAALPLWKLAKKREAENGHK
jgi:hypothetical protein